MNDKHVGAGTNTAPLSRRAAGLVERYERDGYVTLRRSWACMAVILCTGLLFLFLGLTPLFVGQPPELVGSLAVCVPAALGWFGWLLWLTIPADRMRIDAHGVTVHGEPTLPWASMGSMQVEVSSGRGSYSSVTIFTAGREPGAPELPGRVALPLMLTPPARDQLAALTEIRRLVTGGAAH